MEDRFDCVVVGGGPGGYVAAIRASQLGMKAAVVEREHLGGICLNWGCIPTKALLRSSEIHHALKNLDAYGLEASDVRFDAAKVVERSRKVAKRLAAGVKHLMKKNQISVIEGHARLAGPGKLTVEQGGATREVGAEHVILATGARARALPGLEPDGQRIWTYREAMVPEAIPGRLLVVGSGAIGIEFASFYSDMGSSVSVVEILPRILPVEDEAISKAAQRAFEKQGIEIHTSTSVAAIRQEGEGVVATLASESGDTREASFDRVILAVGITGNVEDIGLEGTAVRVEKGHIVVNEWLETGEPGVRAIGDVVGPPWLAHKASHEGVLCVEHIAGVENLRPLDTTMIPGCTYCRPQVASVGLTEAAAREAGHEVRVGSFPLQANGKALAVGETEGFVKTVFDARTGELLGAHMFGPEVTELIQGFAIARTLEATEAELERTIFPHPTLSESMHEAVLAAFGRAVHI
ncbi:MAG: dihydrolipoyl dehydrogenase [Myxococcota bacterium]|nr:dihydrolipoyl dehydrogenase [Myxococcota bacterium]